MCSEVCRPYIHFAPEKGWMNDPNGLVYFDGEYHLFFQYSPYDLTGGPIHWGHAVSEDLLHWEELNIALEPDSRGLCFSGSAIVDHDNATGFFDDEPGLLAFYTAHREAPEFDRGYIEEQCLAYSKDRGRSWIKYENNPIVSSPGFSDFRDPKVIWHQDTSAWIMALASGQEIHFYRSANLIDWSFCSAFGASEGIHTDHPWECPDLFQLNISGSHESRWILVVGIGACEKPFGSFTQYFVGNFNGYEFINENASDQGLLLDQGRDLYAVQSWSNSPGGDRLILGWLNNWKYAKEVPATSYRGMMSVPRYLNLASTQSGLRVSQSFCVAIPSDAGGFDDYQSNIILDAESSVGARRGRLLFGIEPDSLVDLTFFGTQSPDLRLSRKGDRISVQILRSTVSGEASFIKEFEHDYQVVFICAGEISMEWVTDRNSLELLFDDGRVSISQLMITDNPGQYLQVQPVSGGIKILQHQECLIS